MQVFCFTRDGIPDATSDLDKAKSEVMDHHAVTPGEKPHWIYDAEDKTWSLHVIARSTRVVAIYEREI